MAIGILDRIAARAPAPIFALVGQGGRDMLCRLRLDPRVRIVESPRHATILLLLGDLLENMRGAAQRIHDQLPEARAVAAIGNDGEGLLPVATQVDPDDDAGGHLQRLHSDLLNGAQGPSPSLGPADNPVHWRGVGPHGQGGKGMMMGTPYGRKMAMTGPDGRDGLMLDRVMVTVGPFLPWLPPGLRLHVELQGDVVQSVHLMAPRLWTKADVDDVFHRATHAPVRLADLEIARARHHLRATADLLRLLDLGPLELAALRLAQDLSPRDADAVRALERRIFRSGIQGATRGIGPLDPDDLAGLGLLARAAGRDNDARLGDPAYSAPGFQPLCQKAGDAEARLRQRLAEAAQSLGIAARAGDAVRRPGPPVEGPRGPLHKGAGERWSEVVSNVAEGQPWDEFVTTLVSLDLDTAILPGSDDYSQADEPEQDGGHDDHDGGHGHHHGGHGEHSDHGHSGHNA